MLDVRRLRVLREVATHGSFSAAAESLSYTQSAVSQQIAALEREAGSRLVERSARGVTLTDAGRALRRPHRRHPRPPGRCRGRAAGDRRPARRAAAPGGVPERLRDADAPGRRALPRAPSGRRAVALPGRSRRRACACCAAGESDIALSIETCFSTRHEPATRRLVALLDDPMYIMLPRDHPMADRAAPEADRPRRRAVDDRHERHLPGHVIFLHACQAVGLRAQHRVQPGRLQRDPGLRRGGDGRVVRPGPRAGRGARRHRRPLVRRAAAGAPDRRR